MDWSLIYHFTALKKTQAFFHIESPVILSSNYPSIWQKKAPVYKFNIQINTCLYLLPPKIPVKRQNKNYKTTSIKIGGNNIEQDFNKCIKHGKERVVGTCLSRPPEDHHCWVRWQTLQNSGRLRNWRQKWSMELNTGR